MDKLFAARNARETAQFSSTNAKLDRWWTRWLSFLTCIELHNDEFLDDIDATDSVRLLGAFAQSVRNAEFSRASTKVLAAGSCREAMDKVAEVFGSNRRSDPRHGHSLFKDNDLKIQI